MSGMVGIMSTVSRDSKGATTTKERFGDGAPIRRSSSGTSATTSRFGSGFTTSQSSGSDIHSIGA